MSLNIKFCLHLKILLRSANVNNRLERARRSQHRVSNKEHYAQWVWTEFSRNFSDKNFIFVTFCENFLLQHYTAKCRQSSVVLPTSFDKEKNGFLWFFWINYFIWNNLLLFHRYNLSKYFFLSFFLSVVPFGFLSVSWIWFLVLKKQIFNLNGIWIHFCSAIWSFEIH